MKIVSGIRPSPRKILLYGVHGVGKSSWAAKAPKPIFMNMEDGLNDIDCDKTELIKTYSDFIGSLDWLMRNEHPYKCVVIDTIDWLERAMFRDISRADGKQSIVDVGGGYGKGEKKAVPKWEFVIEQLELLRSHRKMGVILLAHACVEEEKDAIIGSYSKYAPDINKHSRSILEEWCDEILFARFRIITAEEEAGFNQTRKLPKGNKERFIVTSGCAAASAKNRLKLPEELPMDWNAYAAYLPKSKKVDKAEPFPVIPPVKETPPGNIEGMVVDGSSKKKAVEETYDPAELAQVFG